MQKVCQHCSKVFRTYPSRVKIGKGRFCSQGCALLVDGFKKGHQPWTKGRTGLRLSPATEFKKGQVAWNKGGKAPWAKHDKQFKKGMIPWNKGLKGFMGGEVHWNWKGGITPLRKTLHSTGAHKNWRKEVLKRDDYTCQVCGSKKDIEVDHIKRWKEHPELRHVVANGRALCRPCHMLTPTYGNFRHGRCMKNKSVQLVLT